MKKYQESKLKKMFNIKEVFNIRSEEYEEFDNVTGETLGVIYYFIQFYRFGDMKVVLYSSPKESYYRELKDYLDNLVREFNDEKNI